MDTIDSLIRAVAHAPRREISTAQPTISRAPGAAPLARQSARVTPDLPEEGKVFDGRYLLDRVLGSGGMGVVYAARNLRTQKQVAIKYLVIPRNPWSHSHHRVTRFVREARAAGRVRHPNVVDMIDVGGDPARPYLVMELLHGCSLWTRMQARDLSRDEAIAIMLGAMRGVAEAHRQGVIHRDLKPENIFIAEQANGTKIPKVLDFGVSLVLERGDEARPTTLTRTGYVLGTPTYMPLEQMRGSPHVDARADIYSLGVVLYEALSSRRPFEGANEHDVGIKMATENPTPLSAYLPDVDPRLETVVMRALARNPDHRYSDVDAFISALEHHRTVPHPRRKLRVIAVAAIAAALGVAVGVGVFSQRGSTSRGVVERAARLERSDATNPVVLSTAPQGQANEAAPPAVVHPEPAATTPNEAADQVRGGPLPKPRSPRPTVDGALRAAPMRRATKLLPRDF